LAAGLYFYNTAQRSPQTMIQLKYGALMMDIHERVFEHLAQTIDVRRIDDLAKIAERQNTMILHMTHQLTDYYLVQGPGMTYRFVLGDQKESAARVEEPVHQEIMQYMMRNNVKTVIDSMPTQEVIYQDIRPASCTNTSGLEPDEKVMLRYSMNISKNHSKS
jgi:hypothetical protein